MRKAEDYGPFMVPVGMSLTVSTQISQTKEASVLKKYLHITLLAAFMAVFAVAAYMRPVHTAEVPARVVMDNAGGRVLFTHMPHAEDYGAACDDCHHEETDLDPALPCGSCHPKEFGPVWAKTHQKQFEDEAACERCHGEVPEEGPMDDADKPDIEIIPLRADAFHQQCMNCHEEMDAGPYGEDSCKSCHAK